jgi:hypothetical protein
MMNLSVAPTQFTEGEALELTEYRPVNRLAVLSAVLGGLSVFALVHSMLMALPIFGAATGLLAYWQLSRPNPLQSGMLAAKWGVFLSLFFGICVGTAAMSRRQFLDQQARTFALQWFQLVSEGKLQEAHQLVLNPLRRAKSQSELEDYYNEKPREKPNSRETTKRSPEDMMMMEPTGPEQFSQFYSRPVMKRLTAIGKNAKFQYLRTIQSMDSPLSLTIVQQYGVTQQGGNSEQLVVEITMERLLSDHIANWRVDENIREP